MERETPEQPPQPILPDLYLTEESIVIRALVDDMDAYMPWLRRPDDE